MQAPLTMAAALLLASSALAMPAGLEADANTHPLIPILPRAAADQAPVWVTVDTTGNPVTVTPTVSTVTDGPTTSTTILSGAPYDVTGTVFTTTYYAVQSTTTGSAAATATDQSGAGAYAACFNKDGDHAPFCAPSSNQALYPGITYYVTWDPSYFLSNASIKVTGYFWNHTTNKNGDTAFSDAITPGRSYYAWTVPKSAVTAQGGAASNVSIEISASWSIAPASSVRNSTITTSSTSTSTSASSTASSLAQSTTIVGPRVLISTVPTYSRGNSSAPTGRALYIGLPTVGGFILLMVCGTFLWNRKARKIGLGNIMSRRRLGGGGYGQRKSRMQRLGLKRKSKAPAIQLGSVDAPGPRYRDEYDDREQDAFGGPWEPLAAGGQDSDDKARGHGDEGSPSFDIPRRDSDALGSLAGTPTEDRRMHLHRPNRGANGAAGGGGNVFRDEIERQSRDRL